MPLDAAQWQIQITAADKTSAAFTSLQQRLNQTNIVAAGVSQGMTMALGAVEKALGRLTIATVAMQVAQKAWDAGKYAGDLKDQAEQIGINTKELQAYRLVAATSGVASEQLDTMIIKLTRAMGEANGGSDDMIAKFDKLGVKLLDSEGKLRKPAAILPEIARGLLAMSSETERNALMLDLFGKSGTRAVTMLEEFAKGNDAMIRSAEQQRTMIGEDAQNAWKKLTDQLETAKLRAIALWAQLGSPVATTGIVIINAHLWAMVEALNAAKTAGKWLFAGGASEGDLKKRIETIDATIEAITSGAAGEVDDLVKARLKGLRAQRAEAEALLKNVWTPPTPAMDKRKKDYDLGGVSQPTGNASKAAKGAGDSAQKKLDALIVERQALEDALSKFEVQGNETVAEMEKRLDRAVALQKKVASLTEGLPKDSPLAQQMTAEATAINDLNQKLEDKRKLMQAAEQTIAKYGDGTKAAARATEDLNKQLAEGLISPQQYAAAMQDVTRAQQEQAIAARGSVEGFDAFTAGMEHIISQSSKMSRSFQYGEKAVQLMDEAISELVQNGEINFNRLLSSFITMIAQMEMKAAMSSLWTAFGGSAVGGAGGILGGLISGLFSSSGGGTAGSLISSGMLSGIGGTYAEGGRPPLNKVSLIGESGPELFIPDSSGTIIPNDQLGGGGGDAVAITMNNNFGGGVTHAEMLRYGAMIEERAKAGAMAGIEAKRKRGGSIKQVFRG